MVFQVPPQLQPNPVLAQLRFESSDTFQPGKGDTRNLAVIFYSLKLQPDYASFSALNWLATLIKPLILVLMSLSVWGLAGFFTHQARWRIGLESIAGLILLLSLISWQVAAEPFYATWALILLASWGCLKIGSCFAKRAPNLPAPFVYIAVFYPVLPLPQFALGRLDIETHFTSFISFLVFGMALVISLIAFFKAPNKFQTIFIAVFLVAAGIPFFYDHLQLYFAQVKLGGDLRVNYLRMLYVENEGQPLYNLKEIVNYPASAVHMPPAFTIPFWPLVRFFGQDVTKAVMVWQVVDDILLIPIFFILNELFGRVQVGLKMWPAILFLILSSGQILETISYGQQNILILFCLCLTSLWVKQQRDLLAGLMLAFPAFLKLLPGMVAIFFLFLRQKGGITGLLIGMILVNLVTIAVVGVNNSWLYFSKAMFGLNEPELGNSNQSWWGYIGRLGVSEVHGSFNPNTYPLQLAQLGYLFSLIILGVCVLTVWRNRKEDWLVSQLSLGLLMLAAILISPITWEHYIVMGMAGIMAMLAVLSIRPVAQWQIVVFAVACCALSYGSKVDLLPEDASGLGLFGSSYRFLATFFLWLVNVSLLWQIFPPQIAKLDKLNIEAESVAK